MCGRVKQKRIKKKKKRPKHLQATKKKRQKCPRDTKDKRQK